MWCVAALLVLALIFHVRELPDLVGLQSKGPPPKKNVYNTALNVIMITAIAYAFGKPYTISYAAMVFFVIMVVVAMGKPVLYDWTEKTAWLLANLLMVGVYFYNGYRSDRRADAAD